MNNLRLELNLALMPEQSLADRLVDLSQQFARRYPAIVRLGRAGVCLSFAPHLTLDQVPILTEDLPRLSRGLATTASNWHVQELACTGLAYNEYEGSLETRREVTDEAVALQEEVIFSVANPLRGAMLLEHDPAGNRLADLLTAPGRLGDNIRRTGYAEVGDPRTGGLFRPHDTLDWFELGTQIDVAQEQNQIDLAALKGKYTAIGVFVLGPYGTCPQLLESHPLAA